MTSTCSTLAKYIELQKSTKALAKIFVLLRFFVVRACFYLGLLLIAVNRNAFWCDLMENDLQKAIAPLCMSAIGRY